MKAWLIWSNEHNAYWAPNRNGYVKQEREAGRYSTGEAISIVNSANAHIRGTLPNEILVPSSELRAIVAHMEKMFQ